MSRRERFAIVALALVAFALRCAFLIDYDEDIDALRFRLAVERFDVATLRPHTPYYPVYVACAKLVAALGASPRIALGIVGAAGGAMVVVATAQITREAIGRRAAMLAGLLALASPHLWLSSQKLLSDVTGTAFFTVALWLCVRARRLSREGRSPDGLRTAAMVMLGVALGVRLSYFPIAIACLLVIALEEGKRAWVARLRDLGAGIAIWLVPLIVLGGPRALVRTTWIQGLGHFTRWGGSVVTVPSPAQRLYGIVWGIWANLLGGAWVDARAWRWIGAPVLLALLLLAIRRAGGARAWAARHPELVASAAAYFVWAALGQNTANKPRHWTPLLPMLIVAMAAGAEEIVARSRLALAGVLLLSAEWLADGAALARDHLTPSPAASIVRFLRDGGEAGRTVITCDLARMIGDGAPGQSVVDAADEAELAHAIEASPEDALVTSECMLPAVEAALATRGLRSEVVFSRPRSRYVDSLWPSLSLVRLSRAH